MSTNVNQLKNDYFKKYKSYRSLYENYIEKKYSLNQAQVDEANNIIYPRIKSLETDLTNIMNQLRTSGNSLLPNINTQTDLIEKKTFKIYEKSKLLEQQNQELQEKTEELYSKQKQIEMGIQKNRYRRNFILFLLFINIVLIAAIYFFMK